jgi:Mn-dependent DtxR family transcriptional regulator
MATTNDVYRKIKEMSNRMANPRPQVQVHEIARELQTVPDQITLSLHELKNMRLIQYDGNGAPHVRLTLLGSTVSR